MRSWTIEVDDYYNCSLYTFYDSDTYHTIKLWLSTIVHNVNVH